MLALEPLSIVLLSLPLRPRAAHPRCRGVRLSAAAAAGDGLFTRPRAYDLAFGSDRDFAAEVAFCSSCALELGGAPSRTFLELASGPGRHARAAASLGLVSVGVDVCAEMVEYARAESVQVGGETPPRFQLGDMADLFCPVQGAAPLLPHSFDIIAGLFGALGHLCELGAAAACFRDCARLLSPTGVLVLELDHPRDLFNGSTAHAARRDAVGGAEDWLTPVWSVSGTDGATINVQWGAPGDEFDAIRQTLQRTVVVTTQAAGRTDVVHSSTVPVRLFTCAELALLGAQAGLSVAAVYGGLDGSDGGAEDSPRLVVVFVAEA